MQLLLMCFSDETAQHEAKTSIHGCHIVEKPVCIEELSLEPAQRLERQAALV